MLATVKTAIQRKLVSVHSRISCPSLKASNAWQHLGDIYCSSCELGARKRVVPRQRTSTAQQDKSVSMTGVNGDIRVSIAHYSNLGEFPRPGEVLRGHGTGFHDVEDLPRTRTVKARARLARSQLRQSDWRISHGIWRLTVHHDSA